MTIGRNNEAPAAYALTSTIKRLLDHLTESSLYSAKDLEHIAQTLDNLRTIVKNASNSYSPKLITLLTNRLDVCQKSCSTLLQQLERLGPGLASTHEKLICILRQISLANTKAKVSGRSELINSLPYVTVLQYLWAHAYVQFIVSKDRCKEISSTTEGDRRRESQRKVCYPRWVYTRRKWRDFVAPREMFRVGRGCVGQVSISVLVKISAYWLCSGREWFQKTSNLLMIPSWRFATS